jgi:hypothetical protein
LTTARDYLIEAYLSFVNDYLTVEKFAEHHGLHQDQAKAFLELAKSVFESKHPEA